MENITVVIGILGTVSSILFAFIGYQRGVKKESNSAGKTDGALLSDIGYIKSGIDDLKNRQDKSDEKYYALLERVTKCESSTTQAHKRIDTIINEERGRCYHEK